MTPEERAQQAVAEATGTDMVTAIANAIRAAEDDAFERAAKAAEAQVVTFGSMAEESWSEIISKDCARAIRALKHPA